MGNADVLLPRTTGELEDVKKASSQTGWWKLEARSPWTFQRVGPFPSWAAAPLADWARRISWTPRSMRQRGSARTACSPEYYRARRARPLGPCSATPPPNLAPRVPPRGPFRPVKKILGPRPETFSAVCTEPSAGRWITKLPRSGTLVQKFIPRRFVFGPPLSRARPNVAYTLWPCSCASVLPGVSGVSSSVSYRIDDRRA